MPHELDNYSVDVYGLFDGDPGAFYFEYIMTYVGRIFFQDYTCVNRSYTGVIRESADPDSGKSYAKDRQRHGCAVLILKDVKNMNSVAFNARFSQYDRAKGGNATFGSIDLVTCPLTASQKRRLKRTRGDGAAGEDLEEDEGESYTSRDYRWNCMFDVLTKYADENEWKVGEANWVNPDKCTSEEYQFCPNPIATGEKRDSHDREPYLYIWYMHQIGLKQRNGQIPFVPALRRKRLQNLGASMSKQLKEQVWEKVQERGKQSSEESRRGTQFDRRGGGMSFLKGRMN